MSPTSVQHIINYCVTNYLNGNLNIRSSLRHEEALEVIGKILIHLSLVFNFSLADIQNVMDLIPTPFLAHFMMIFVCFTSM